MPLMAILGLALAARLAVAVALPVRPLEADALSYDMLADSLARGDGFALRGQPSVQRAPGFPFFLAMLKTAGAGAPRAVRAAHAMLEAATVVCVFGIGLSVFGRREALLAALLYAMHPGAIRMSAMPLAEPLFTCLLSLSVLLTVSAMSPGASRRRALLAGAVLGLANFARPVALLLPLAWVRKPRVALAIALAMAAVIAPWMARNYAVTGKVLAVSTGFAPNLFAGTYAPWRGEWRGRHAPPLAEVLHGVDPDENRVEAEGILLRASLRNVREHPVAYIALVPLKVWNLLRPTPASPSEIFGSRALMALCWAFHLIFLVLAAIGLLRATGAPLAYVLSSVLAYWVVFHVISITMPRFLLPVMPLLSVFAARGAFASAGLMSGGTR